MTPVDDVDPVLSISVFQNPYLTGYLDIYLISSEALIDTSVHCELEDDPFDMDLINPEEHIWKGDYDLYSVGPISIYARARDNSLNWAETTYDFSSSLILAEGGGIARSVDGLCMVSVPRNAVDKDAYVLIFHDADIGEAGGTYRISPSQLKIAGFMEISIAYPEATTEPEHLCVARMGDTGLVPVDCYIDTETGRAVAYIDHLGSYGLMSRPDIVTPTFGDGEILVLQNVPNPFAGSTVIAYEVPRGGRVHAEVISIDGRLVTDLLDDYIIPGRHDITWDGCDAAGRRVASGVYFYRIGYESKTVTKKMVHLR